MVNVAAPEIRRTHGHHGQGGVGLQLSYVLLQASSCVMSASSRACAAPLAIGCAVAFVHPHSLVSGWQLLRTLPSGSAWHRCFPYG